MGNYIERYQSALRQVEARVLDCFAGYRTGRKSIDEIVIDIRDVGKNIRAAGDPHQLAALEEIMDRPVRAWQATLNGPVDGGAA